MSSSGGMDEEGPGAGLTVSGMIKEIQGLKDKFKNEDEDEPSLFQDLEKATVLQECRAFNDAKVVTENPRRCCLLITKLLHIVTQGEALSSSEVTEVFFGVTKLFQSSDTNLRRMVYFFIKEVAETCNPDDIIIATSSLVKDMNSTEDLFRANSIRVLARMIDNTMLGAIERYLKQAIVDKNTMVASSALVSGMHLIKTSPDGVRRWVNEVTEAVQSGSDMVQFHALSLLHQIKQHDRLAISKLVTQLTRSSMSSPLGTCLLIRYISRILYEEPSASYARAAYQFLETSLRHKSEMVIYEAAKAICQLPTVDARDLNPAITVLQLFLSSPKPTLRFAAMRTLSLIAMASPSAVVKCNDDMESLIGDANRSIATLAITTLLKTGTEGSVDRLMKQISSFMNEIADEFKIVVVTAIRQLCLKYPQKHRVLVGFLANFLREEGGFDFKKAIVDSIVELIHAIPETKESSLLHLCEFIEDCEFTALSTQILHLIGSLGPTTQAPARYIRFIYNRVILENAAVRAAAVSALGKFAAHVPSLRASVSVLLDRSLQDEDDEVRDRATIALRVLGDTAEDEAASLLLDGLPMSLSNLERSLRRFEASQGLSDPGLALSLSTLPIVEDLAVPAAAASAPGAPVPGPAAAAGGGGGGLKASSAEVEDRAAALYQVPELSEYGRVFRSSAPSELTESETEYVVACVKHILEKHVILQFTINNTIQEQMLAAATVKVECSEPDLYSVVAEVGAAKLTYGAPGSCYVVLERAPEQPIVPATFTCELKFNVVELDPATGEPDGDDEGFPEDYPLEDLEVGTADFMAKTSLGDFRRAWEDIGGDEEVQEKFALQFKRLDEAVTAIIDFLGMQPCDGTHALAAAAAGGKAPTTHHLHLSGVFVGNIPVLVRSQLALDKNAGVVLKMAVRSKDPSVSQMVADCIR